MSRALLAWTKRNEHWEVKGPALPAFYRGKQVGKNAQPPKRTYFPMIPSKIAENAEGKGRLLRLSQDSGDRELSRHSRTGS